MRNECSIIRDLLPLYIEEMVSADTAAFMEEHLEKCDTCRAELGGMKAQNDVEKAASDIPASSTMPLKTFRQKWQRKKALLVCASIIATIMVMCCTLFVVEYFVYQEKIMVNDAVYMQEGNAVIELPAGSVELGYLRGISHRSTGDPMGNFMATNLDEKYGGYPIYQSGDNDQIIYLEDYRGFYIPFELAEYSLGPKE